jgi:hypothetical protein
VRHYTYWLTATVPVNGALNYIGKRSCHGNPDTDTYMSSSTSVKQAIAAGVTFDKKVLAEWDTAEEALSHEILLHEIFDVASNPLFFNKVRQTSTGFAAPPGVQIPEERRQKISTALKGQPSYVRTTSSNEKLSAAMQGNKNTLGLKHTEDTRQKISAALKGRKHTEETRQRISASKLKNKVERSNGNTN